ncbi:DUF2911 domain-containing protein [Tenacibaculum tangerinum]|uniref:DUF2911 domain-containing protein n=1 Tax=Tenacibaculum tangerinum TaxID=3038772 RepID=A0ABY8L4P0_9FLAO|nr:DUF2911 domain-containing protein [Tenacibaculum tangerinum]WGH74870.1 DUF2911 domain-containing protein [Tenacibaculum tangerinum]
MKKSILFIIFLTMAFVFSNEAMAQKFPKLDKSPMDAAAYPSSYRISDKTVKIIYSRPQLKGRSLARLAPVGKVWRTGADEAAEITFYKDVVFGGKSVKAGTYTLFTIPGDNEWTVILNSAKNVWGAYFYKESDDIVRVKGTVSKAKEPIEVFSMVFEGEGDDFNMYLGWDDVIVTIPVKG